MFYVDDLTKNWTWRKTDMNFEEKKTTYKEVTENSDALWKNMKLEAKKNKLRRRQNVVEKSQSESKKYDAIDVGLCVPSSLPRGSYCSQILSRDWKITVWNFKKCI